MDNAIEENLFELQAVEYNELFVADHLWSDYMFVCGPTEEKVTYLMCLCICSLCSFITNMEHGMLGCECYLHLYSGTYIKKLSVSLVLSD